MAKQYAVYHCEKGNISSGGIGNHIDRKEGAEHTYKHADPSKKDLNQNFNLNKFCSLPLHQAIEERIKEGYKSSKTIRKDAVKYTTHILTGSHEKMKEIEKNPTQLKNWIDENKKFLEQEFGKDNIVRFVLHRDEKTPHLHAVTVNLTSDGRLSAKEIIGNKKTLQKRQDKYADFMKPFSLERGLKNTGIKHENASKYYTRIEESLKNIVSEENLKANKTFLGIKKYIDIETTVNNYESALKREKTTNKSFSLEIDELKNKIEKLNERNNHIVESVIKEKKSAIQFAEKGLIHKGFFEYSREQFLKSTVDEIVENYKAIVEEEFEKYQDVFSMKYFKYNDLTIPKGGINEKVYNEIIEENKYDIKNKLENVFKRYENESSSQYSKNLRLAEEKRHREELESKKENKISKKINRGRTL